MWFIDYVQNNWEEGITVVTPDVDWLDRGLEIEDLWKQCCSKIPQLYVPNTWRTSIKYLNIVGHALRKNSLALNSPDWIHCLGHVRKDLKSKLLTYDSISEILN